MCNGWEKKLHHFNGNYLTIKYECKSTWTTIEVSGLLYSVIVHFFELFGLSLHVHAACIGVYCLQVIVKLLVFRTADVFFHDILDY